ncbi:MAG: arylsulfatase [Paludibacter sp.]|nr:arylsulfatase [Paludibacter sp.]
MKKIFNSILLVSMIFSAKAAKKTNVIVILSDDQGYGDFSCHGNPVLKTPNLDKLHDQSIRFSNFHVAPLSTPTRGQLITGLDAMHNKASTVLSGCCMMDRELITMPEVFSLNGYKTGIFGKWHLGDNYPDRPMDRGFDKSLWIKGWGLLSEMEFDNDYYKTRYFDSLTVVQSDKYCTDLWFQKSMEWMDEMHSKGENFFTYLPLNAAHAPFYALREDFMSYCKNFDEKTASFFGMIQSIDKNVGKLMQWLETKGIADNTIVIFMNDNGGTGGIQVYNANMRGEKGDIYDGGHRAACFIRWPQGNLGLPRTIDYASEVQDILPTLIDMLGLSINPQYHFDGISLKPVMTGQPGVDRMFVVQQGVHVNPVKYNSSVIWNNWRLVGQSELYDITSDPGQQTNLAQQRPEIMSQMKTYYDNWWKTVYSVDAKYVPLVIGDPKSNPVILSSSDWIGNGPNTQWNVALAKDEPDGYWVIDAKAGGKYRIELSRWPFHLNRSLTASGPSIAVGGTSIRAGKALNIGAGCVSLNGKNPAEALLVANAVKITVEIDIPTGLNRLKAFFKDNNGNYLCGAYYVKIEKVS